MKEEQLESIKHGKPWNVEAVFTTFKEADSARNEKLKAWQENNKEGMQVKIHRRRSDEKFMLKTRLHPDFEVKPTKEKKNGKNKRSRKSNTKKRDNKFDPGRTD